MFIVYYRLAGSMEKIQQHLQAHFAWVQQGIDDGVFLLVGALKPDPGGCIITHNISLEELQQRINVDPFYIEQLVTPEIQEFTPSKGDERLSYLFNT